MRLFRATSVIGDSVRLGSDDTFTLQTRDESGTWVESTPEDLAALLSRASMLRLCRSPNADSNDRSKLEEALSLIA